MQVSLIGFRATGKSTVGRLIATRLGWNWFDSDVELQRVAGKEIARIFREDGEPVFRQLEEDVILALAGAGPRVLSVGGGAVLRPAVRQRLRAAGPVVWLAAGPEVIRQRMDADPNQATLRPPLTPLDAADEIRVLLAERNAVYKALADLQVETDFKSAEQVADEVIGQLRRQDRLD